MCRTGLCVQLTGWWVLATWRCSFPLFLLYFDYGDDLKFPNGLIHTRRECLSVLLSFGALSVNHRINNLIYYVQGSVCYGVQCHLLFLYHIFIFRICIWVWLTLLSYCLLACAHISVCECVVKYYLFQYLFFNIAQIGSQHMMATTLWQQPEMSS